MRGSVRFSVTALLVFALFGSARAGHAQVNEFGNPLKLAPRPTSAAITVADLQTRLYIFADDSMMGRRAGREGHRKGNDYIASELRRLGVEPAGEDGGYFQALPAVIRKYTSSSTLSVDGRPLRWLTDFVATPGQTAPRPWSRAQVIYGGTLGDTSTLITAEQAAGKLVVLTPAALAQGRAGGGGGGGGGGRGGRGALSPLARFANAAGVATVDLHNLTPSARALINNPEAAILFTRSGTSPARAEPAPANLRITPEAAERLLGKPVAGLSPGTLGGSATAKLDFLEEPAPELVRNVIGIIRGSDPALASEYVAIGAHSDHVGFNANPVDHDSARAVASAALQRQIVGGDLRSISPEERARIRIDVDSLRRVRAPRRDSIANGADDDGSGSMAVLEIAEAIMASPTRPRRSILLIWHTAEERGLIGSAYFTQNATVPREAIVTQINIDMIGRGRAGDIPGGGDDYLAVVGASRLSTELGQLVETVNRKQARPLELDYRFDGDITWPGYQNIYNRSDHANYARYNIPIAFFFTGLHQDYHQVTDEPQYIDYPHYTRITQYIHDLVIEIGNRDARPAVDRAADSGH